MSVLLSWLGTGHERRAKLFACFALVWLAVATVGVLSAPDDPRVTVADESPESNTLIALQGYQDEGRAIEVTPDGEIVWEYDETDDVFDVEALGPDRVQVSTAEEIPDAKCPDRYRNDGFKNCVRNSLKILNKSTQETVWEYAWYDVKLHEHELHDADHYTVDTAEGTSALSEPEVRESRSDSGASESNRTRSDDGEDRWVMVDMGNDRVFAVNRQKEVVWEWNATDAYDRPDGMGPEADWTHVNDVDRLRPGVFQISLRNFDTVAELHVENGSASLRPVVGPNDYAGRGDVLYEQHNPDRLANDHLLVADSEHDRVVELDADGEVVWQFGGSGTFDWPRDADRLSNGHTLVADSYNDRVAEVDENGDVVWAVKTGGLPYEADRLPGEGSSDRPTAGGAGLAGGVERGSVFERYGGYVVAIAKYVLPRGLGDQVFALLAGVVSLLGAAVETVRAR